MMNKELTLTVSNASSDWRIQRDKALPDKVSGGNIGLPDRA
jgi:hypothetical protein